MKKKRRRKRRVRKLSDIKPRIPIEAVLLLRKKVVEAPVIGAPYCRRKEKAQFRRDVLELGPSFLSTKYIK
ncbi:MAG: hypothetical protein KAS32_30335 [Candidatus Peribacteraceae bacterium]|nr:hypothetical protein [Candidatus Peribacteraceae bacterium]